MKINQQAIPYVQPMLMAISASNGHVPIGDIAEQMGIDIHIAWSAMSKLRKSGMIHTSNNIGASGGWIVNATSSGHVTNTANTKIVKIVITSAISILSTLLAYMAF